MMIVLATLCYRFGSWGQKANLFSNFEHNVWWKFWSWNSDKIWSWSLLSFLCWCFVEVMLNPSRILVDILKEGLGKILKLKFYGEADVWFRFWSWCLVEILKMKFDQDLCLNLWYKLNPRVRCAFGNVFIHSRWGNNEYGWILYQLAVGGRSILKISFLI